MKLCNLILLIPILLILAFLSSSQTLARDKTVSGEILIKYKADKEADLDKSIQGHGMTTKKTIKPIRYRLVKLPKNMTVDEALEKLKKHPAVEYAGPNHTIRIADVPQDWPNDPVFYEGYDLTGDGIFFTPTQWGLYNDGDNMGIGGLYRADIHAPEAWAITKGSPSAVIASIDTGVDDTHEDLYAKTLPGYNAIDGSTNTMDDNGHGTFTSAIAAADTNNWTGVAGVSWESPILPVKVIDSTGYGTEADGAEGVVWAANHGAKVLNMSFATDIDEPALRDAITYAWQRGCLCVGASGNENVGTNMYPAAYSKVLSVGATNEYDERCSTTDWGPGAGSNYGAYLDVMAPGNNITSAYVDPYFGQIYWYSPGTSAAAPFVSGTAALIWSIHPDWTNQQVMDQIIRTADDISTAGWDQYTGWGRINAYRALTETTTTFTGTLGQMRSLSDGRFIQVAGKVITAGSGQIPNMVYIEEPDRSGGIMVYYASGVPFGFALGDRVDVTGTTGTRNGEKAIVSATLTRKSSGTQVRPVAITNRQTLGLPAKLLGGMLVKVYGRVSAVGWDYIYIDDGSGLWDGMYTQGLRIFTPSPLQLEEGRFVSVVGTLGMDQPSGATSPVPVVRPRRPTDIKTIP